MSSSVLIPFKKLDSSGETKRRARSDRHCQFCRSSQDCARLKDSAPSIPGRVYRPIRKPTLPPRDSESEALLSGPTRCGGVKSLPHLSRRFPILETDHQILKVSVPTGNYFPIPVCMTVGRDNMLVFHLLTPASPNILLASCFKSRPTIQVPPPIATCSTPQRAKAADFNRKLRNFKAAKKLLRGQIKIESSSIALTAMHRTLIHVEC